MAINPLLIGQSALSANQQAIDVVGQNIANAGTAGYHRQVIDLANRSDGPNQPGGVEVLGIQQVADGLLDQAVLGNTSDTAFVTGQLNPLQQLQANLAPQEGSLDTLMGNFFDQLEQLSAAPSDTSQRGVLLQTASEMANGFNSLSADLSTESAGLDAQIQSVIAQVNTLAPQVAQLNQQIEEATVQGGTPNDLLDQRSQLIGQLGQFMNVQVIPQKFGVVNVIAGGAPVVLGNTTTPLQFAIDANGNAAVRVQGTKTDLQFDGGQLGGYLQARNTDLPNYQQRLNTLAQALVSQLDGVQATGLGLNGPASFYAGTRAVDNVKAPLTNAGLGFPPTAGTLYVGVTNLATGQRTLSQVAVDPATQSLQDFAANFTAAVGNAQAVVDDQTNTLRIIAQPGYAVDFAGGLPTAPATSTLSGTATASLGGSYTGPSNDTYSFQLSASGTVGVTPGLTLNVRDSSGTLLKSLSVGEGYQPGSDLDAGNGLVVQLSAGSVNANEGFSTPVVAKPDTAGILTALGINTLFAGQGAADISVRPDLLSDPSQLAAGLTTQQGDSSNLSRMAALRDAQTLGGGTQTFSQFYEAMVGDIGSRVQSLGDQQTAQQAVGNSLQAQQKSISGVDTNEELVHLLQYQQAFQLSSKYLAVVNQNLDDLINIITPGSA